MRHILISAVLLGLVSACSTVKLAPHRIDVQQGNALDQENIARLQTGLNRSQVRFLLGTPLVVDPFRNDRWDYVYVHHKAGRLAEQKRISLFFDGDTLVRIEGDVPPRAEAAPNAEVPPATANRPAPLAPTPTRAVEASPLERPAVPQATPVPATAPVPSQTEPAPAAPGAGAAAAAAPRETATGSAPTATSVPPVDPRASAGNAAGPKPAPAPTSAAVETSVVAPLTAPKSVPAYRGAQASSELALIAETDVAQIRPDAMPAFGETAAGAGSGTPRGDSVLRAVRDWARAWANGDEEAYLAAYDLDFTPPGGGSRVDWEKRRRMLLGASRQIDVQIESPAVAFAPDGSATVTFTQHYRTRDHRDVVTKQVRLVERRGKWLIVDEKVLSHVRGVAR